MKTKREYTAYCLVCCGGGKELLRGKRQDAERAATGHLTATGHDVTIFEPKKRLAAVGVSL